jgi:YidC/Oxa1 family membrane protein insertase
MDIRRTILLMIFSFSLLMLWNSWQVHQGNPPLFGAPPPKAAPAATTPPADAGATSSQAGVPTAPAQVSTPGGAPTVPGTSPAPATQAQTVTVKSDVLALTFDLQGAQLIRADLLMVPGKDDKKQPFVLLSREAGHTYVVQSGLTGAPAGSLYPTHLANYKLVTDAKELS